MEATFTVGLKAFFNKCHSLADKAESMNLFQKAAVQRLSNESSASTTLNLSMKPEWSTAHLSKMDMETRLLLQCQQKNLCPGLPVSGADLDQQLASILNDKESSTAIMKAMLLSNLRLAQWIEVVLPLVDDKFNDLDQLYTELSDSLKDQVNSRVRLLTTKIEKTDKLLKSLKESPKTALASLGQFGKAGGEKVDIKNSKSEKDVEKLKVKVIALEKQNAYLVTKEKELEGKLREFVTKGKGGEKKKIVKKSSLSVSQDTKKKPKDKDGQKLNEVMIFDSPMPSSSKGETANIKTPVSNIVSKQEKLDKLETSLMEYTQLLSSVICSLDHIPEYLFEEKTYVSTLEMIVETLPKIEKRKILLSDKSEWLRGLLEIGIKLIDNQALVKFSPEQELVGAVDSLPLSFTPKTTYWMNVVKSKNQDIAMEVNSGFGKLVPNDAVTRKINELLTGYLNFLRSKIAEINEKLEQFKAPVADANQPYAFTGQNQGLEIRQNIKKIRSFLSQKALMTKAMVSCYLFIERAANISNEQQIYFTEEIADLLSDRYWRDAPLLGQNIRSWYVKLNNRGHLAMVA